MSRGEVERFLKEEAQRESRGGGRLNPHAATAMYTPTMLREELVALFPFGLIVALP